MAFKRSSHNPPVRFGPDPDDPDNELAFVGLAGAGGEAVCDRADYERVVADGLPALWTMNQTGNGYSYVRTQTATASVRGSAFIVVARAIAGAGRHEQVRYRDGDRRNLRRSNLRVSAGGRALSADAEVLRVPDDDDDDGTPPVAPMILPPTPQFMPEPEVRPAA